MHITSVLFFMADIIKTVTPTIKNANVESKKGEPSTAPLPISFPRLTSEPVTKAPKTAIKGSIVSGNAVPKAAKILPNAPSLILKYFPRFSTAFVNISQKNVIKNNNINVDKIKTIFNLYSFL